jgi:alpha-tubulin suppressor-like RCC1 family protein
MESTSCAWRQNGDTLCWGSNVRGGLGNASPVDMAPHPVPGMPQMKWSTTTGLFGGVGTFFAKDPNDQWYRWGANLYGTYGDGFITAAMCGSDVCDSNTKIVMNLFGYRTVSISNHVLGISKGGKLWAWGRNDFGQLGKSPGGSDVTCPGNFLCNPNPKLVQGL